LLAEVARNADLATGASHFWSIGPTLSWLIVDAGRIRANIAAQGAREEQQLSTSGRASCVLGYRSWRGRQTVQTRVCSRVDRPREAPPFREVFPEPLAEIETRPVEAGFHRSRAQIENHPDLLGGQALDLGQHVHRSVHRR
jgi:hypothetical protein